MMKSECTYTNNSRIPWLDIAKAIAMTAVVFSHEFASVKPIVLLCNSFMLPLFFMCSGFCLSPEKYGMASYLRRKAKTLLVPYIGLGMLVSLLHIVIEEYDKVMSRILSDFFSWQTLWFLPVLFVADIISYLILTKWGKSMSRIMMTSIFFLMFGIFFCLTGISLPMDLEVVPISIFYLTIGFLIKKLMREKASSHYTVLGLMLLIGGTMILVITKGNLILKLNEILPLTKLLFSTMECVGIMFILPTVTSPRFAIAKYAFLLLEYIGKNTMVIFAFHMPIFFYCQKLLRPLFNSQLYYKPLEFVLIWGVCLLLIPVMNRYAPILIAKKRNK